jgi:hypothetical protein
MEGVHIYNQQGFQYQYFTIYRRYFLLKFDIRLCYMYLHSLAIYSWTVEKISKGIFLLLKTSKIWLITICVVLIQNIVIFQKGGGYILKIIPKLYVTCNDVTLLMNILYNTVLESGGTKDHFRWVKVPGTAPFWKSWISM